jgi:hypothetical protein
MPRTSKGYKRGSSRTKRASRRTHRRHRRRGGADALEGAPLKYDLADSWSSRMSRGQGTDYFKYHQGQHGGMTSDANMSGAPLSAHTRGTIEAIESVSYLKDQAGGRRSHRCKKHGKKHCKCRKSHKRHGKHRKSHRKSHRRHSRKRGGNLEYVPFPNKGMLLDSQKQYSQAGLNPDWKTDPAFRAAEDRSQQ